MFYSFWPKPYSDIYSYTTKWSELSCKIYWYQTQSLWFEKWHTKSSFNAQTLFRKVKNDEQSIPWMDKPHSSILSGNTTLTTSSNPIARKVSIIVSRVASIPFLSCHVTSAIRARSESSSASSLNVVIS